MEKEKTLIEKSKKELKKIISKPNDVALENLVLFGEGIVIANTIEDRSEQSAGE